MVLAYLKEYDTGGCSSQVISLLPRYIHIYIRIISVHPDSGLLSILVQIRFPYILMDTQDYSSIKVDMKRGCLSLKEAVSRGL